MWFLRSDVAWQLSSLFGISKDEMTNYLSWNKIEELPGTIYKTDENLLLGELSEDQPE